ncbi:MAG: hypothetical protein ACLRSW_10170 [Christensenellaceae bacterium]
MGENAKIVAEEIDIILTGRDVELTSAYRCAVFRITLQTSI